MINICVHERVRALQLQQQPSSVGCLPICFCFAEFPQKLFPFAVKFAFKRQAERVEKKLTIFWKIYLPHFATEGIFLFLSQANRY